MCSMSVDVTLDLKPLSLFLPPNLTGTYDDRHVQPASGGVDFKISLVHILVDQVAKSGADGKQSIER